MHKLFFFFLLVLRSSTLCRVAQVLTGGGVELSDINLVGLSTDGKVVIDPGADFIDKLVMAHFLLLLLLLLSSVFFCLLLSSLLLSSSSLSFSD